jgi:broad specificity phosphatase PhoE
MLFASPYKSAISLFCLLLVCVFASPNVTKADDSTLWEALKSGDHFVLLRHALAPGFGDPTTVDLSDCSTQRNLSEEGRQQSRKIGEMFRANGISDAVVLTSQWCRCRETANLMGIGKVEDMTSLNSFFQRRENQARQLNELEQWHLNANLDRPTVLVTHQVVITGLTDYFPSSGEIVFVKQSPSNDLQVVGTIDTL